VNTRSLAGRQLGAYRIEKSIAAGGMGEVYRARDTRLGRDVAVKILPPAWTTDPQRRTRFEREARAIAALNHPNICTVHDVGQDEGIDYLVMELIDGESLAERMKNGPLRFDQALAYAIEVADALDKAHRQGIIHRDLKPANVMLAGSSSGNARGTHAKLLDFGLARIVPPAVGALAAVSSDTKPMTAAGVVLGTLQYMAPEQIQGYPADARTDIFAFGALLYEMLTGRRAFEHEGPASTAAAILTQTPPPVSSIQPLATPQLDHVVATCLEKHPDERWQTARDLSRELTFAGRYQRGAQADPQRPRRRAIRAGAFAALAIGIVAASFAVWFPRQQTKPAVGQRMQFTIPVPESVGAPNHLSVSPDGSRVSFTGADQIWVHEIATGTTRLVQGVAPEPARFPFWSPDSQVIAYFQAGRLKRIPAGGGIPQEICSVTFGRGGSWGPDDTIIFANTLDTIFRVPASGGDPVRLTSLDAARGETAHMWPHFLPDGRRFTYIPFGGMVASVPHIASLNADEPPRAVGDVESEAYIASGFVLTVHGGTLRAKRLADAGPGGSGRVLPLARPIIFSGLSGKWLFAATPDVLAYVAEEPRLLQFSSVTRRGESTGVVTPPVTRSRDFGNRWSLSPDGARLAFRRLDTNTGNGRIWLLELRRGELSPLTSDVGDDRFALWASNNEIVFTRSSASGQDLHLSRLGGDHEVRIGESSRTFKVAEDWRPERPTLLFSMQVPPKNQNNFWILERGGQRPVPWFRSEWNHFDGQFSPDGRWVAYTSNESGTYEVYARRFPEADGKVKISTSGGGLARWRKDGKALFYAQRGTLMEVDVDVGTTIVPGLPRRLLDLEGSERYAVLPDGSGFMLFRPVGPVPRPTITVVVNWAAGVHK
jgi:eukaryotic-like serine/threonine-protein kinase